MLHNNKSPSRLTGELDNRGSHYYLALYWAQALAEQNEDRELQSSFIPMAKSLTDNEEQILAELNAVQGDSVDLGGYFHADMEKMMAAMRPSETFNQALESLNSN